jgi:hypothetical protein
VAQRRVVWPVASWPSLSTRCTVRRAASRGMKVSASAMTPTRATEASATKWPRWVRNTEIAIVGSSSPTAPAAST